MLPVLGKKAVLEWSMKEGLIGSSYVCPKCGKSIELRERTGAIKEETSVSLCFFPTQFKVIRLKRGRKSKTSSSISPLQRVALPSPACGGN
ncbi:hypothetical protein TNCV_214061 [Trichonephila clavipes]|nr:hypothetical protein TNCV_214061 [Trichonephila clavipes]